MLFNSFKFLIFFPAVVTAYFLIPHRIRWLWLLLSSYYFYMCWKPEYVVLIIVSTLVDYYVGLRMERAANKAQARKYLILSLFCNLGLLFAFKYFNFFNDSFRYTFNKFNLFYDVPSFKVLLPIGISFYTFQTLSYSIDVYRGKKTAEKHLGIFALYVSFFPQLVAGPIERAWHLLPQFHKNTTLDYQRMTDGLKLMLWGLFKKIVIADRLAHMVNLVYNNPTDWHGYNVLFATYFFAYQIYCDFSGYSDIAIGAAQVLGYDIMQNFRRPYFATSIAEFWRRWHISLSTWFKDYLYVSLGGNRVRMTHWCLNIMVVFLLSGLWHGANWTFVVWGFLHGVFMLLSRWTHVLRKKVSLVMSKFIPQGLHTFLKMVFVFHLVALSWIFFRASSIADAVTLISNLFQTPVRHLNRPDLLTNVFLIGILIVIQMVQARVGIRQLIARYPIWIRWSAYYTLILLTIFWGMFDTNEFIYFQF